MPPVLPTLPPLEPVDIGKLSLRQAQERLALMVCYLVAFAISKGFQVTLGDAYRDPRVFGPMGTRLGYGQATSAHKQRLALDLNLYRNGVWLKATEDHSPLGEFWESIGGTWGGRFEDGNHYSLKFNGVA